MAITHEERLEYGKLLFGYLLLFLLAALAAAIALGDVKAETSYGLQDIEGGLLVLAGAFSTWFFRSKKKPESATSLENKPK